MNARYATPTEGTWTYMIRWMLPCVTSRGATPNAITTPARTPRAATMPSQRVIAASSFQQHVDRQEPGHDVDDVGGHQQLQPVRDAAERLPGEERLGGFHDREQERDEHGQEQDREQQLERAAGRGHRPEERADVGDAERAEREHEEEAGQGTAEIDVH